MMRTAAAAGIAALLAACANRVARVDAPPDRTRIDHALLNPADQPQYQVDDLALFVMPMELESPPPAFPAGIAPGDVAPVTVCVEAWLDDVGNISRLVRAHGRPGCPAQAGAGVAPYEQAVVEAMRRWTFSAAAICRFPEKLRAQRERRDCTGKEVELDHVPVRLTYAFTFERQAGRARVAGGRHP